MVLTLHKTSYGKSPYATEFRFARRGNAQTRRRAKELLGHRLPCGGLWFDKRRMPWLPKYILGEQLNDNILVLNYLNRLLSCIPKGQRQQKHLIDQNLCALH